MTIIDDSYNAAPASMLAALDVLADLPGRRIAVLGEMLELGEESEAGHLEVGRVAGRIADVLVVVGADAGGIVEGAVEAGSRPGPDPPRRGRRGRPRGPPAAARAG